jgi:hypothetical protein
MLLLTRAFGTAGGISPEYQPQVYSKDDRPLVSASRSGLLRFSHPYHRDFLPVFKSTPRLGATIQEQLGPEADARLGKPGQRVNFGLSLGLCKVYAEVGVLILVYRNLYSGWLMRFLCSNSTLVAI